MLIALLVLLLLCGGFGGYRYGGPYVGGGIGTVLLIVLALYLIAGPGL